MLLRLLLPGFCAMLLCSCSDGRPPLRDVSGTVQLDGKPLPTGDIIFFPLDKNVGPDAGKIVDGAFKCKARQGKHRVEIRASKLLPMPAGKAGAMGETAMEQEYLPDRYGSKSTLEAEVTAEGPNEFNFKLSLK